jgi:beta-phosphoglucomutase-like phosphatase (HAD superfamily)
MLRAVIFDFNGIIVDDEPIHFKLFQKVLGEEAITLTEEVYYERYLGFDGVLSGHDPQSRIDLPRRS